MIPKRVRASAAGALAAGTLTATLIGLAPQANAAADTTERRRDTTTRSQSTQSCGVEYTQRAHGLKRTITATNNCYSGTLCIRIKTWGGPWWNVETSPRLYIDAGESTRWRWARGRNNWRVYYC